MELDPTTHVENARILLKSTGEWPNFHDATVNRILFARGDLRPDDNVWISAWIMIELETLAEENPQRVVLKFHDCDGIRMIDFNHSNDIYDLEFSFEARGFYLDGKTPLPPYIRVRFTPGFGIALDFRCFRVEALPEWAA